MERRELPKCPYEEINCKHLNEVSGTKMIPCEDCDHFNGGVRLDGDVQGDKKPWD